MDVSQLSHALQEVERNRERLARSVEQIDEKMVGVTDKITDQAARLANAPSRLIQKHPLWMAGAIVLTGVILGVRAQIRSKEEELRLKELPSAFLP